MAFCTGASATPVPSVPQASAATVVSSGAGVSVGASSAEGSSGVDWGASAGAAGAAATTGATTAAAAWTRPKVGNPPRHSPCTAREDSVPGAGSKGAFCPTGICQSANWRTRPLSRLARKSAGPASKPGTNSVWPTPPSPVATVGGSAPPPSGTARFTVCPVRGSPNASTTTTPTGILLETPSCTASASDQIRIPAGGRVPTSSSAEAAISTVVAPRSRRTLEV